ncbi:MAG: DUF4861 domain-containing protein [Flavobacteriaceae bacterium]|nr:MAG: DUF4861 domain-containing protein [Flavobacteriaceae bacterium]
MNIRISSLIVMTSLLLSACAEKKSETVIVVKNSLDVARTFETVELTAKDLKVIDLMSVGIKDLKTGKLVVTQLVDLDADGQMDQLIFQPVVSANSVAEYQVISLSQKEIITHDLVCFSRFVPERTDDYTWENDKVSFRVYGPTAQKMVEDSVPGGTLSSGVDVWLKRVEYPIIDKWYKEFVDGVGSYHEDTGEGLDNFHVGVSRGVGGIAVKSDGEFYYSKNFSEWKTITTGPLRTSFSLKYENWDANGKVVEESKIITLDKGNNFTQFNTTIKGVDQISVGLTLHEKDGIVSDSSGWINYWQPHADSEISTSIVAATKYFNDVETYNSDVKDLSNAYAHLNVVDGKVIYYAGFTWKKSNQFKTKDAWIKHLDLLSLKINNPLVVEIK